MLYTHVADRIEALIRGGALRPGDRVPSVRKLSEQQDVSISTAVQAYRVLEDKGLVEARPQSGYYVRARASAPSLEPSLVSMDSPPVRVETAAATLRMFAAEKRGSLAPLASALPSPELFPTQGLTRALARAARDLGPAMHSYEYSPGSLPLRREIARRGLESGCALVPDEIVITNGALEALNVCLRAVAQPGDVVAIESPTYFGILQVMESLGLRALEIPMHPRDGMDLAALEAALEHKRVQAIVAIPAFNNPLGSQMPDANKERLVALAARYGVPLIEDDVYGDLPVSGERPRAARSFDQTGNVLLVSGFSKSFSPGARVGWVAPGRYFEEVKTLKFMTNIATPTVLQAAVADFLHSGAHDRHLRRLRAHFARQVEQVSDAVAHAFPAGTRLSQPRGGYVLWVELPAHLDTLALHDRAAERHVGFAPGPMFSPRGAFRNCLRLNCGYPFTERTAEAIGVLGQLAQSAAIEVVQSQR